MATAPMGTALRQIQRLFVEGRLASLPDGELLERFLSEGDEAAFTALVERHGPMVLGTCRAVLRDANAAEDAFQATFLVLVCKARSIRGRGALASWLYQVAHRIAIQAGAEAARRRKRERLVGQLHATDGHRVEPDDEWREILHEEVARLSEKYRLPLLLCDLEGKTHAQAATELNCGEATVRRRLAGARELLRSRLIRRGVALTAGTLATTLGRSALATVPPGWVEATVKAAATDELDRRADRRRRDRLDDGRGSRTQVIARHVIESIAGGCRFGRLPDRARRDGLGCRDIRAGQGRGSSGSPDAKSPIHARGSPGTGEDREASRSSGDRHVSRAGPRRGGASLPGRCVVPEHSRVPAPVSLARPRHQRAGRPVPIRRAEVRFRYVLLGCSVERYACAVLAQAAGYAFGLANYRNDAEELTLQLARDDVPISGRIIDLQGQPVVGATVTVLEVGSPAGGSLDGWLKALEERKEFYGLEQQVPPGRSLVPDGPAAHPAREDRRGRTLSSSPASAASGSRPWRSRGRRSRPSRSWSGPAPARRSAFPGIRDHRADELITIYGATFEHVAGPTRPIEGIVRDIDTKKPLAGIMVRGERSLGEPDRYVQAITDAQGHYRLVGLPRGREGNVRAVAPVDFPRRGYGDRKDAPQGPRDEDLPYLPAGIKVGEPGGMGPIKLDINLKRGVWVTGRVIEEDTGKPVRAQVEYYVFAGQSSSGRLPRFSRDAAQLSFRGAGWRVPVRRLPGPWFARG